MPRKQVLFSVLTNADPSKAAATRLQRLGRTSTWESEVKHEDIAYLCVTTAKKKKTSERRKKNTFDFLTDVFSDNLNATNNKSSRIDFRIQ